MKIKYAFLALTAFSLWIMITLPSCTKKNELVDPHSDANINDSILPGNYYWQFHGLQPDSMK